MKRFLGVCFMLTVLTVASSAYVSHFTVTSVKEQTLVSHERIKITVYTGADLFPYNGQIGWKILFSTSEIGDQDPQYMYAVWVLPAQSYDLSQEIWFVRPAGLVGEWHYRIDAVNSGRAVVATSGELTYTFSQPEKVYEDTLTYVSQEAPYWNTALGLAEQEGKEATATLTFWSANGDPYPVLHGSNELVVDIPANGNWAGYLWSICPGSFTGNIKITSASPLKWVTIINYEANPIGLIQSGKLE